MRTRRGWSGKGSFEFEIERVSTPSGEILNRSSLTDEEEAAGWELMMIPLVVKGSAYFEQGYISGPPEDCYPDEGGVEIESILGPDGKDWYDDLTKGELESVESQLSDICQGEDEYDGPDPDDYPDDEHDCYDCDY